MLRRGRGLRGRLPLSKEKQAQQAKRGLRMERREGKSLKRKRDERPSRAVKTTPEWNA